MPKIAPRTGRSPALFAALASTLLAAPGFATGRTFYVDFAGGSDSADGLTPATAWQRAPGDWAATGVPARTRLAPGDTVRFRGGVRYRGSIWVSASGTADRPIRFEGSAWGDSRAIMDGSHALAAPRRCTSAADCLGSPHWRSLWRVVVPAGTLWSDWLFLNDRALQMAQWPSVNGPFDYDDTSQFAAIPLARLTDLKAGFIAVPGVSPTLAAGSPRLGLWHASNDVVTTPNFTIEPAGIRFTHWGYRPYANRDNRFAILNAPQQVDGPGKFALSGKDEVAVFWPPAGASSRLQASTGARRSAFRMANVAHVQFRGFSFTNYVGTNPEGPVDTSRGLAIGGTNGMDGIRISQNVFRSSVQMNRIGLVHLLRARAVDIVDNDFTDMPWSTAINIADSVGPVSVRCNDIGLLGRNGIRLLSVMRADIAGNRIRSLRSIHGAGMNVYLDSRVVTIRNNLATQTDRPLTMHGNQWKPLFAADPSPDIRVMDNVFLSEDPRSAAISSWGANLRNVTIAGNMLANPRYAVRLDEHDRNILLADNVIVGDLAIQKGATVSQSGNRLHSPSGNGAMLVAEAAQSDPTRAICS